MLAGCTSYPEIDNSYELIYSSSKSDLQIYYTESYTSTSPLHVDIYEYNNKTYTYNPEIDSIYVIVIDNEVSNFIDLIDMNLLSDSMMEKLFDQDISVQVE